MKQKYHLNSSLPIQIFRLDVNQNETIIDRFPAAENFSVASTGSLLLKTSQLHRPVPSC